MVIKSYVCPDCRGEEDAARIREVLANLPLQGIDFLPQNCTVRIGLLDENDDDMVKACLTEAGFPPEEVTASEMRA